MNTIEILYTMSVGKARKVYEKTPAVSTNVLSFVSVCPPLK
jgi:hypothetical protein